MSHPLRFFAARLLAVLFGLLLAVLVAEIGLRVLYGVLPMNLQMALREVRQSPFSEARLAPPPLWKDDTDYQMIVQPGAVDSLQAGSPTVLFRVTSYNWWGGRVGFRSPQPTDGRVPAVALGDSHTFCFTAAHDCWVTRMTSLTGVAFANLGQPVTGSASHARIFADFVANEALGLKQPALVLWQFYGNDFNDDFGWLRLQGQATSPPADLPPPVMLPDWQRWLAQQSALAALLTALTRGSDPGAEQFVDPHRVIEGGVDIFFGQRYIRDSFDMTQARNLEGETLSHRVMLDTRTLVKKNGGQLVMLLIPTKEEVYCALTEPKLGTAAIDAIAAPRLRMLDFCAAQQIRCLDLLPALQAANREQLYFSTDPHLTPRGNEIVAQAVAAYLRDQGLVQ
jgi:hypothetical protein